GDPLPGEGIPVLIGDEDDGRRVAAGGAGGGDIGEPAGLDESLHFGAAVGGDEEEYGVLDRRPQQTDLPRAGVGRMLVEVVAVRIIGADDEAELRYRGEDRRPGADGHASVTEQPAQPGLPALFGRLVGAEHGDVRETRGLETAVQHRELTVV